MSLQALLTGLQNPEGCRFLSFPASFVWDCWVFNASISLVNVRIGHYYVSVSGLVLGCQTAGLHLQSEDASRTKVQKEATMVERGDQQTEEGGPMRSTAPIIGKEMGYG